jgi:hypothetical protein
MPMTICLCYLFDTFPLKVVKVAKILIKIESYASILQFLMWDLLFQPNSRFSSLFLHFVSCFFFVHMDLCSAIVETGSTQAPISQGEFTCGTYLFFDWIQDL